MSAQQAAPGTEQGHAAPPGAAVSPRRQRIARLLADWGSLVVLGALLAAMAAASPAFLTVSNLLNVARQVSINAIIAAGQTFVIITGGIDLSVGSIVALSGCVGMLAIDRAGLDVGGIPVGILVGGLAGAANGLVVARAHIPPFIVTLAGLTIFRGVTLIATGNQPIIRFEGAFRWLGTGLIGGVPVPVIVMALVFLGCHVLLARTAFGAHVYAVGGNEEAARLSGVPIARVKFWVYVISGLLTGLAGMILTGRLSSAQPSTGMGFELDAIAAVVLGGTSLMGGRGGLFGTLIGALIIGILNNGFNLLAVDSAYQQVAKGLIIIAAVFLDARLKRWM